jgi:hypothetical protein
MIEETSYKETIVTGVEVDRPRMGVGPAYEREYVGVRPGMLRLVAWGPIWAGVVCAVGVQVILLLLGTAIGLSVVQARAGDVPNAMDVAAGIWWVLSSLVALFIGGWVAGFLAMPRSLQHGALHGFLLWCTVTALSAALLATAGGVLLGGGLGVMGNTVAENNISVQQRGDRVDVRGRGEDLGVSAERAAESSAGVAWWTFAVLVLSAGAAAAGGALGQRTDRRIIS